MKLRIIYYDTIIIAYYSLLKQITYTYKKDEFIYFVLSRLVSSQLRK